MKQFRLHIKNMVCPRCIMAVELEMRGLGIIIHDIKLGYVTGQISESLSLAKVEARLNKLGFEVLKDADAILVENVKLLIRSYLDQQPPNKTKKNLSAYISGKVGRNYNLISKIFSQTESTTIEKYFIAVRMEKVKELIDYNELTLSQIADQLGYSNVHYLSNQFKKFTGMPVSKYKQNLKDNWELTDRKSLDAI